MSWRPHSHAYANARAPEAWGKCDRCGSIYFLRDLRYQYEWAGSKQINKRLKVCSRCLDKPQEQLKTLRLQPDPKPVRDPRPINNGAVMGGYAIMQRSAQVVSTTPGILLVPGVTDGQHEIGGDAGYDAGPDAAVYGMPIDNVTLQLFLEVVPPASDPRQGQTISSFAYLYEDSNQDAGTDAGPNAQTNIPLSIDPPED